MKTLALVVLLVGSGAVAEVPPMRATIGFSSQLFSGRGYDLVDADDALVSLRLGAGTTFSLRRFELDVGAAFSTGGTEATAHQRLGTVLSLVGFEVSGTARWLLLSWLQPYVRLGVGADWATLQLGGAAGLSQTVGNVAGHAGLGVQLSARLTPQTQRGVFLTADLGAGGVLRPVYDFDALSPPGPVGPQADPIGARGTVSLGALPLSGITIHANVGARF